MQKQLILQSSSPGEKKTSCLINSCRSLCQTRLSTLIESVHTTFQKSDDNFPPCSLGENLLIIFKLTFNTNCHLLYQISSTLPEFTQFNVTIGFPFSFSFLFLFFSTIVNDIFIQNLHIFSEIPKNLSNQDNNYPRPMKVTTEVSTCKDVYTLDLQTLRFLHQVVVLGHLQFAIQNIKGFFSSQSSNDFTLSPESADQDQTLGTQKLSFSESLS